MKKRLEALWFTPYTPIIIFLLIVFGLYQLAFEPIQDKIKSIKSGITIKLGNPKTDGDENESKVATARAVVAELNDIIDLPSDEEPEIVTITDIEKFKDQPFFKKAANGNKLLIYPKSKKAILYDQENKKILDVGPITDATESARQLEEYCVSWATQSAQLLPRNPSPSPPLIPTATAEVPPSPTPEN